jgi:hypothetical protein
MEVLDMVLGVCQRYGALLAGCSACVDADYWPGAGMVLLIGARGRPLGGAARRRAAAGNAREFCSSAARADGLEWRARG